MTIKERNELVENYIPLANKIAFLKSKTTPKSIRYEDLRSVAYIGLIEAADRFNLEYSCSFYTYAKIRIIGSIKDYLKKIKFNFCELKDNYYYFDFEKTDTFTDLFSFLDCTGQKIIKMYYIENRSMKQIGDILGLSESRISQMMSKYKKIIRKKIK